jgi:predicted RNA-binding Zn ribbon-like protein
MSTTPEPLLIADHLALDFLNTTFGTTNRVELLNNDLQVYQWMNKAGMAIEGKAQPALEAKSELLSDALELRAIAYELIIATKSGKQTDTVRLNTFLARGGSYCQIERNEGQHWILKTHRYLSSAKDLLTPIAEAIADLLVNSDFSLVRKCENPDCTLWFYDRTKSHQRRWCDMAICGNRMKAAAFRARQKSQKTE